MGKRGGWWRGRRGWGEGRGSGWLRLSWCSTIITFRTEGFWVDLGCGVVKRAGQVSTRAAPNARQILEGVEGPGKELGQQGTANVSSGTMKGKGSVGYMIHHAAPHLASSAQATTPVVHTEPHSPCGVAFEVHLCVAYMLENTTANKGAQAGDECVKRQVRIPCKSCWRRLRGRGGRGLRGGGGVPLGGIGSPTT